MSDVGFVLVVGIIILCAACSDPAPTPGPLILQRLEPTSVATPTPTPAPYRTIDESYPYEINVPATWQFSDLTDLDGRTARPIDHMWHDYHSGDNTAAVSVHYVKGVHPPNSVIKALEAVSGPRAIKVSSEEILPDGSVKIHYSFPTVLGDRIGSCYAQGVSRYKVLPPDGLFLVKGEACEKGADTRVYYWPEDRAVLTEAIDSFVIEVAE